MKDLLQGLVFVGLFLVPFLPVYVENSFFFPFITGKNFAFRIIIEVVFASWIILAMYDVRYRPKFSWIVPAFLSLLVVMFAANLFGEYPLKSFWSNFERMDGYVTLVHVFMYFIVLASVLTTEKLWSYFLHTSLAVALCVAIYGLMQHTGMVEGGRTRVDSRLGNAAYMAVYMLFHIFIVFYLFVRSKLNMHRILYALTALILVYTLLLTGTRGTFLGFVGGTTIAVAYVAVFGYRYPKLRKIAAFSFLALAIFVGGFIAMKDSDFVQNSGPLSRIAKIDLQNDLVTRGTIWNMALEGVKERPILGWGQGNFNYVFNAEYDPSLYAAESWFDRVHDIFLDWLIAGGILGLLAYFSIMVAALYYLFWEPMFRKEKEPTFNVLERAVLIGLLAGYVAHNIVVFDNIISYIFYGTILALIHSRVSNPIEKIHSKKIDERIIVQIATPVLMILVAVTVYFTNLPGILASGDIIDALKETTATGRLSQFDEALSRNSFANQEIVEQLAQNAMNVARTQNIPAEEKQQFVNRAEEELSKLVKQKPNDARLHTFFASFYRTIGNLPEAQKQAAIARTLSPKKQAIIIEQGVIELQMENNGAAEEYFKEAFELEESNTQARVLYATSLVLNNDSQTARELVSEEKDMQSFAANDYALSIVDKSGDRELLVDMFKIRIEQKPNDPQNRASLAFLYYQEGNIQESVDTLEKAALAVPEFARKAECFIGNIQNGNKPDSGC